MLHVPSLGTPSEVMPTVLDKELSTEISSKVMRCLS